MRKTVFHRAQCEQRGTCHRRTGELRAVLFSSSGAGRQAWCLAFWCPGGQRALSEA